MTPRVLHLAAPALLAAALVATEGCARNPDARYRSDRTTMALVGRFAVSVEDFQALAAADLPSEGPRDILESRLWDRLVEEVLVLNDALEPGTPGDIVPLSEAGDLAQRRETVDLRLREQVYSKVAVTEEEVRLAYSADPEAHRKGRGYLLRQITLPSHEEAREVREQILAGKSFDEVAEARSLSPDRGRPEYFEDAELPEYLATALRDLRPGLLSQPVAVSAETWQVVRIERRPDRYTVPFEQAAPQIRLRLADERSADLYRKYLASLREKYPVREFPKKFPFPYQKESP